MSKPDLHLSLPSSDGFGLRSDEQIAAPIPNEPRSFKAHAATTQ
ncbi:hypothetical protein [Cohnella faecalis]|nr:hypothetical protein [Cohnella faecalis]